MEGNCSACSSSSRLAACLDCATLFCASHVGNHLSVHQHYQLQREGVQLLCCLCKNPDLRALVVAAKGDEAVVMCRKGCAVTLCGVQYPGRDSHELLSNGSLHAWCFERRLCPLFGAPRSSLRLAEKHFYERSSVPSVPKQAIAKEAEDVASDSSGTSTLTEVPAVQKKSSKPQQRKVAQEKPEEKRAKGKPAKRQTGHDHERRAARPAELRADYFRPAEEEAKSVQNVVPDVFEDEDQYLSVFTAILELEVKEERKQKEYMRTEAPVRWYKEQRVVGEVELSTVEEISTGDDLLVTDSLGNNAIVTVNDIRVEENWINFKGAVDTLSIDHTDVNSEEALQTYTFEFWESGSIKRMKEGLKLFHRGTGVHGQTAEWILGLSRPTVNETRLQFTKPPGVPLNRYQEEAIQYALANDLALIQGPPGTGKTATAAVVIYNMFMMAREQVLVCAPSNIAVDQLTLNIAKLPDIKVLRIYGKSRLKQGGILPAEEHALHTKVRAFLKSKYPNTGDAFLDKTVPLENILATLKISEDVQAIEQDLIDEHNVICCTCAMSTTKKLASRKFKFLLVDEAGFSAEPETLLPILKGGEHLVLVGDHMQLPPVVKSRVALKCRYGRSMFERLINIGIQAKMLQMQYRMHPALSAFPSREFYNGKLRDGIEANDRVMENLRDFWLSHKPMIFYDLVGLEEVYGKTHSYCNREEAGLVECLLYELLQHEVQPESIGIITPYDGQRRFLLEYIEASGRCDIENVEIKNIDGFQGREKDLIIISCVRSNSEAEIGFLTEARRLNVAITRAKFGLIMVGNARVLRSGKFWQGLIAEFSKNKCLQGGDQFLAEVGGI